MKFSFFFLLGLALIGHCWLIERAAGGAISYSASDYEYVFKSATAAPKIWTTVVTRRIIDSDSAPSTVGTSDKLRIYSAANELESFQIVLDKSSKSSVTVAYPSTFTSSSVGLSCGRAGFSSVSAWGQGSYTTADTVTPFSSGSAVSLSSSHPTVLFCTATVPAGTTGKTSYSATISLTVSGNSAISVEVDLYVFGFSLTTTSPFQTYFQSTPTTNLNSYTLSQLDAFKAVYLQHHWNYRHTDWPNGIGPDSWDGTSIPDTDPSTAVDQCIWAGGCTGIRYSLGKSQTWKGTDTGAWLNGDGGLSVWEYGYLEGGRPDPFGGVACGTNPSYVGSQWKGWMCSSAYETEFGKYLAALESFSSSNSLNTAELTRGFFYTVNEPQVYNDYTVAAYLCKTIKASAPNLPVMVTREAHPWIIDRADSLSCGYDIWVAHVSRFPADITWDRQVNHGETSWFYSLDTDNECDVKYQGTCSNCVCNPAFAPFVSNKGDNGANDPKALNSGMHYRVIPWVAWANRITGWGYYHDDICWTQKDPSTIDPVVPTIAASLIREGIDDYAYIWAANGRANANPYTYVGVDDTVVSVGFGVYAWNDDAYALQALRNELGKFVEGTRSDIPYLTQPYVFAAGSYNIDFGPYNLVGLDYGEATTFTYNGESWMGMGYPAYDSNRGYGWNSYMTGVPNSGPSDPVLFCEDTHAGLSTVSDTVCYDNFNHASAFFFAVDAGAYDVTVGIGYPDATRQSDVEYVRINNLVLRNYTCNNDCVSVREYSGSITVHPHSNGATLVMTVGSPFVNEYTMLNYLKIKYTGTATRTTTTTTTTTVKGATSTTGRGSTQSSSSSSGDHLSLAPVVFPSLALWTALIAFAVAFLR